MNGNLFEKVKLKQDVAVGDAYSIVLNFVACENNNTVSVITFYLSLFCNPYC